LFWGDFSHEAAERALKSAHWLAIERDGALACIGSVRMFPYGAHIGIVATREEHRNQGLATAMVKRPHKQGAGGRAKCFDKCGKEQRACDKGVLERRVSSISVLILFRADRKHRSKELPDRRRNGPFAVKHHLMVSSWLMMFQMRVRPCKGMFGSFASSSRMKMALAARTSRGSFCWSSLLCGCGPAPDIPWDGGILRQLIQNINDLLKFRVRVYHDLSLLGSSNQWD